MASRHMLAGLVVAAAALVGCTATPSATPTPTPQPSWSCTPEAGGTPFPCSQIKYEQWQAKDAQYQQAEVLYRAIVSARMQALRGQEPDPAYAELARGSGLMSLEEQRNAGLTLQEGDFVIRWIHRLPGLQKEGSEVALETCLDGSEAMLVDQDGSREEWNVGLERAYFAGTGESMRMVFVETKPVEQC